MATFFSLRPGCSVHVFHNGSDQEEYLIQTADMRRFRLSASARGILERLDAGASVEQLSAELSSEQAELSSEKLQSFILANYGPFLLCTSDENGAREPAPATPAPRVETTPTAKLLSAWPMLPKRVTHSLSVRLSVLYWPVPALLLTAAIVAAHVLLYSHLFAAAQGIKGAHAAAVVLLCIASVIAHELGHTSALARYGGSPGGIGFGLYILLPVFYADVSDIWKLRQWQRVVVDLGGIYFQQLFFTLIAPLAVLYGDPSARAVCLTIDLMTLIAINPALRFDGYWVIADWLGLPRLNRDAWAFLRWLFRSAFGRRGSDPGQNPMRLSRFKTGVFVIYALASNVFLAVIIMMNLRWVQGTAFALIHGLPLMFNEFWKATLHNQWLRAVDVVVATLFFIASGLTLFIGVYWQVRAVSEIARRHSGRIWKKQVTSQLL